MAKGTRDFQLASYRRPLEDVKNLTASEKTQLTKLLSDEGTTIEEAVTSDEPITMELVDVMEGDQVRYQLYLWSFGCGALLEASTTRIVANVVQHAFQMIDDDPAVSAAIASACKRDAKRLEIQEEINIFPPPAPDPSRTKTTR